MTLKKQILYCLEQYPETRNSDIELMIRVWKHFTPTNEDTGRDIEIIHSKSRGQEYIALNDLRWLQREDHIKRIRAKIQNEKKLFLPTDPATIKARKQEEIVWRDRLGYRNKKVEIGGWPIS